jgi:hypothetical protein
VYPEETPTVNGANIPGSVGGQVNFQMDGADHNDTYLNTSRPCPNSDAVQEFSPLSSNFSAEYGNAGGGVVNIVTPALEPTIFTGRYSSSWETAISTRASSSPSRRTP